MRFFICISFLFILHTSYVYAQQTNNDGIKAIYELYQNKPKTALVLPEKYQHNIYKKHISQQISATCQFNSSCSEFMSESVHHMGLFKGFLLGIDRLSRCGASDITYNYLPSLKSFDHTALFDDLYYYK